MKEITSKNSHSVAHILTKVGLAEIHYDENYVTRIELLNESKTESNLDTLPSYVATVARFLKDFPNSNYEGVWNCLRLNQTTEFALKVIQAVVEIPQGQTCSYQMVAEKAGRKKAARAVGSVMRKNLFPLIIPCHRVIKSSGQLGRYSAPWLFSEENPSGEVTKAQILDCEMAHL